MLARLRINYMSDLHFEFNEPDWLPPLPVNPEVIVLAGDISTGEKAIEEVLLIHEAAPSASIIFVAGNHEFYRTSIDKQLIKFTEAFRDDPKIHFLENNVVKIGRVKFLGCTLWSGFNVLDQEYTRASMKEAQRSIGDFHLIRDRSGSQRYHPMSAIVRHRESRTWLANELKDSDPEKTVVVTHFPPTPGAKHFGIQEDLLTNYFQNDLSDLIRKYQPAFWIYGHNHYSHTSSIGRTMIVSNQLGYPGEAGLPEFNPEKYVSV